MSDLTNAQVIAGQKTFQNLATFTGGAYVPTNMTINGNTIIGDAITDTLTVNATVIGNITFQASQEQKLILHPIAGYYSNYSIAIEGGIIRYTAGNGVTGCHIFCIGNVGNTAFINLLQISNNNGIVASVGLTGTSASFSSTLGVDWYINSRRFNMFNIYS